MAEIKYSKTQITELKQNKYVKDCTQKYITFTDEFKILVLKGIEKGKYHRQIFYDCGFPEYVGNSELVPRIVGNWKYKMKTMGLPGIIGTKKGRKKGEKVDYENMSLEEKNKYLQAKVDYLNELYKQAHGHYP